MIDFFVLPLPRVQSVVGHLALQLLIALKTLFGQRLVFNRQLDGAAGLALMGAVLIAASQGELFDIFKGFREVPCLNLKLAHTRGVNDQAPARQQQQLTMGGGVAALVIILTDLLYSKNILTHQAVDQR